MKKSNINYHKISYAGRRKINEDSVIIAPNKKSTMPQLVLAVADGMGGYQKGDMASKMMIEQMQKLSQEELPSDPAHASNLVRKHIKEANRRIFENSKKIDGGQMGTTISGAILKGNRCLVFNVGDSRTYIINSYGIEPITHDHSPGVEGIKNGNGWEDDAGKGRYSHALTRSIGTDQDVDVDIFPLEDFRELKKGEIIFSCTDGLWNKVTNEDIWRELIGRKNIHESLEALVSLAYFNGSTDNISIVVIEYGTLQRKSLNLKSIVPLSKLGLKPIIKKNNLLSILLAASVIILLAVILMLMFKLSGNAPVKNEKNHEVVNHSKVIKQMENKGGEIIFSPRGGKYKDSVQVQLSYAKLLSTNNEEIPSEIYYTTGTSDRTVITKSNGQKYISGEKIRIDKPGEYIIKARVFSNLGKDEGPICTESYIVEKSEPQLITVTEFDQLDEETREDILSKIKETIVFQSFTENKIEYTSGNLNVNIVIFPTGYSQVNEINFASTLNKKDEEIIKDNFERAIKGIRFLSPKKSRDTVKVNIWIKYKIERFQNIIRLRRN